MSPIPVEATEEQVTAALQEAGLPIARVDLEEPGATAKRAAWVRLVAPELPWTAAEPRPYHEQPAAAPAAAALLAKTAPPPPAEGEEAAAEGGDAAAAEGSEEAAAAEGAEGAAAEGAAAAEDGTGAAAPAAKKPDAGLEGPHEDDAAGEVYATPTSPRAVVPKGSAAMADMVDGDAWRIAREFAAQLQRLEVEVLGEPVVIEAPLVQVMLFINHLSKSTTTTDSDAALRARMAPHGDLVRCFVVPGKGYGFVEFALPSAAAAALAAAEATYAAEKQRWGLTRRVRGIRLGLSLVVASTAQQH